MKCVTVTHFPAIRKDKYMDKEMKTIAYEYLFNYFGGDKFENKIVTGASIQLAIRPYKNGNEVKFEDGKELSFKDFFLFQVFDVSFDKENVFNINRNIFIDNLFRIAYGFDKIKAEITGYSLDVATGLIKDVMPESADKLPTELQSLPVSESLKVSEDVFKNFILNHLNDFDISDNQKAQCPSVGFI